MNEKLFKKLLYERKEKDWFEFKRKLKLYQSDESLSDQQRDELIKDILGLANGNSHIIRKTKYLIIGADDDKFDDTGCRLLYDVDYKVPLEGDLLQWLASACSPAVVGLTCGFFRFNTVRLFIITIPPTFDLHETTRELNASGHFQKHTVFMRHGEHTLPASVRDGITILQLKHLYRQEISNPPAILLGAIAGGVVAFITVVARINAAKISLSVSDEFIKNFFVVFGFLYGGLIGWMGKQWNEIRYSWRYLTWQVRLGVIGVFFLSLAILWIINR